MSLRSCMGTEVPRKCREVREVHQSALEVHVRQVPKVAYNVAAKSLYVPQELRARTLPL